MSGPEAHDVFEEPETSYLAATMHDDSTPVLVPKSSILALALHPEDTSAALIALIPGGSFWVQTEPETETEESQWKQMSSPLQRTIQVNNEASFQRHYLEVLKAHADAEAIKERHRRFRVGAIRP